jgi:hypothetical protein
MGMDYLIGGWSWIPAFRRRAQLLKAGFGGPWTFWDINYCVGLFAAAASLRMLTGI